MPEARRSQTAGDRLEALRRDQARLRRARLMREVAGPRWRRMMRVVPILFDREGPLETRLLRADAGCVVDALREDAVFALDSAMRLSRGHGVLGGGDVHAYLVSAAPLMRLAEMGLIVPEPWPDSVLIRPWTGPPRLLACLVPEFPPCVSLPSGHRVVDDARLIREVVGAVGARPDLFALVERSV